MRSSRLHRSGVVLFLCILLLLGCADGRDRASETGWTVKKGALALERDLLTGDDEDVYFGQIYDVTAGDDGQIYVADGNAAHVKALGPDGTLRDTIGRRGDEGPGTFRRPSEVVLARGDSLYVLDGYSGRVSVFAPDGGFEYSFMARGEMGSPRDLMVSKQPGAFFFAYSPGIRPVVQEDAGYAVRRARASGEVGDSLFTARPPQFAWKKMDRGMRFMYFPFARGSHFAFGPEERIHHAWSDSLRVVRYTSEGAVHSTVEIPFEYVPVTEEEREEALGDRSAEDRTLVEEKMPSTKPAFEYFLVDDAGRYWFGRPTATSDSTDWWVADPDEKQVVTKTLPSNVQLKVVTDGHAYGQTTTDNGAPAVVRYRVRTDEDALSE